jgi:phosphoribosylamine---glycine ligase
VIEYNARFGDPEVMNVLPLMQADFVEVCKAIIDGMTVRFKPQATVCKYVVPKAYPQKSGGDEEITLDAAIKVPGLGDRLRMYWAAVHKEGDKLYLTGSRAVEEETVSDCGNAVGAETIEVLLGKPASKLLVAGQ